MTYLLAFFAIWWAWMNFTWFASAYDCDDAPYRLLTLVQMSGVLVLAAGVHGMFEDQDYRVAVVGYVIMRLAMVAQWARAARLRPGPPEHRAALRRRHLGCCRPPGCSVLPCRSRSGSSRSSCWRVSSCSSRCGRSGRR